MNELRYIRNPEWLYDRIDDRNLRIIDCQFSLADEKAGKARYQEGHIPGAAFLNIHSDLSASVREHGGRHPVPSRESFIALMQRLGVDQNTHLIAYDGGEMAFAGRFLWICHVYGYINVALLNGGLNAWKQKGYPISTKVPRFSKTDFAPNEGLPVLASYEKIKNWVDNPLRKGYLIDSRESRRYKGIEEPIDHKAGHIPGAINYEWTGNFTNGAFMSVTELQKRFKDLEDLPITVYCGSGITATPNYIALLEAGFSNVQVYAGSFSDWISYADNEVVSEE